MRAQRDRDEPHDDGLRPACRDGGRPAAGADGHGSDPVAQRQAALQVEPRAPADLDVARPVGGHVLDQLVGDALERLGVLHDARWAGRTHAAGRPGRGSAPGRRAAPPTSATSAPASTPRDAASSSAVAGRREPSRWRWSSAFGMRRIRARSSAAMPAAKGSASIGRPRAAAREVVIVGEGGWPCRRG